VMLALPNRRYEGRIRAVTVDACWNRFRPANPKAQQPRIDFEDGHWWVPNIGARRVLVAAWGEEMDDWVGNRLAVQLVDSKRRLKAGGEQTQFEKRAEPLDDNVWEPGVDDDAPDI